MKFKLSEGQGKKLITAIKDKSAVSIRLSNSLINKTTGIPLLLTKTQINKLNDGKIHDIEFSAAQTAKMCKHGGFLPAIMAALPTIIGLIGGVTGIASNIKTMATGNGVRRCPCGKGVVSDLVGKIPLLGNVVSPLLKSIGLGVKPKEAKGLYLKTSS